MMDAFGLSCDPPRLRRPASGDGGFGRAGGYVLPTLVALVLAGLGLRLGADLASRLDPSDPAGALSVLVGMAAVAVTLMPFTVLFAQRARRAWLGAAVPARGRRR